MSDYGRDFLLKNGDVIFTEDGDIAIIEGPRCIAQDLVSEIGILFGTLFYDNTAGSSIPLMLNDVSTPESLLTELERLAIEDPRIDPESVHADQIDDKTFRISFTPMNSVDPVVLNFNAETGAVL